MRPIAGYEHVFRIDATTCCVDMSISFLGLVPVAKVQFSFDPTSPESLRDCMWELNHPLRIPPAVLASGAVAKARSELIRFAESQGFHYNSGLEYFSELPDAARGD